MRAYSPSQTGNFMANPVVRDIQKAGWVPNVYTWKELALVAGGAYQEGVSYYYNARRKGKPDGGLAAIDGACHAIRDALREELDGLRLIGITWKDEPAASLIPLADQMTKTFIKGMQTDPIPPSWEILAVEPYWKDLGWCKPDIVVKTDAGKIFPIDAKFKRQMDTDRLAQTLQEYMYSWQFMHYNWATCMRYDIDYEEPGTHGLLLSVSRPHRIEPHYFPIDPVLKRLWLTSAKSVWAIMAAVDGDATDLCALLGMPASRTEKTLRENSTPLPPWHTFLFHGRYGLDPYGEAVLYHKLDAGLMAQSYINTKEVRSADKAKDGV